MPDFKIDPDYMEVKDRIIAFRLKHPEGTLQSSVIRWPEEGFPFVAVEARAYRTPDDPRPGVGLAWENYPGLTPYTKHSELMNSETSAWGRALIAVGAADAKRGIASAQEVRRGKMPERVKDVETHAELSTTPDESGVPLSPLSSGTHSPHAYAGNGKDPCTVCQWALEHKVHGAAA